MTELGREGGWGGRDDTKCRAGEGGREKLSSSLPCS